jgi:hypothetical protein
LFLENAAVAQLGKKFPYFMEPEDALLFSPGLASDYFFESDKPIPPPPPIYFDIYFNVVLPSTLRSSK